MFNTIMTGISIVSVGKTHCCILDKHGNVYVKDASPSCEGYSEVKGNLLGKKIVYIYVSNWNPLLIAIDDLYNVYYCHLKEEIEPTFRPLNVEKAEYTQIETSCSGLVCLTTEGYIYESVEGLAKVVQGEKINLVKIYGELGNTKVVKIAAGPYHCFAIGKDGNVYGWGSNVSKQLAYPEVSKYFNTPVKIDEFDNKKIKQLSTGICSCMALDEDGDLYFWGSTEKHPVTLVDNPFKVKLVKVSCGFIDTLLLDENGDFYCLDIMKKKIRKVNYDCKIVNVATSEVLNTPMFLINERGTLLNYKKDVMKQIHFKSNSVGRTSTYQNTDIFSPPEHCSNVTKTETTSLLEKNEPSAKKRRFWFF